MKCFYSLFYPCDGLHIKAPVRNFLSVLMLMSSHGRSGTSYTFTYLRAQVKFIDKPVLFGFLSTLGRKNGEVFTVL